jgi:hypothetical protein
MGTATAFGGSVTSTSNYTNWNPETRWRDGNFAFPAGNTRLDGSLDNIYLHSISAAYGGAAVSWGCNDGLRASSGGTWMRGGASTQVYWNKNSAGSSYIHRNAGAGGTIFNSRDSVNLNGCFVGSFTWSTAPGQPATITPGLSGRDVTVVFAATADGGGETITAHTVEYAFSADGISYGAYGNAQTSVYIFTNLPVGYYKFRVYASNYLTSGAVRESSAVQVKSGGKRHTGGGTYVDTATFKRHTGGGTYVDVTTLKRHTGGNTWVDVS